MVRTVLKLWVLVVGTLVLGGCADRVILPDGTEMSESAYMAKESMDDKRETREENWSVLMRGFQNCGDPSDQNVSTDEYEACQQNNLVWQVQVPYLAEKMNEGGVDAGYWSLVNAREQRRDPVRYINAAAQTLNILCTTGVAPWSCASYGSGGNEFTFKARDDGRILVNGLTAGPKSPLVQGDENVTGVDETQQVPGSNNQTTRSTTRPSQFSQPDLRGGNAGEGDAGDAGDLTAGSEGAGITTPEFIP